MALRQDLCDPALRVNQQVMSVLHGQLLSGGGWGWGGGREAPLEPAQLVFYGPNGKLVIY